MAQDPLNSAGPSSRTCCPCSLCFSDEYGNDDRLVTVDVGGSDGGGDQTGGAEAGVEQMRGIVGHVGDIRHCESTDMERALDHVDGTKSSEEPSGADVDTETGSSDGSRCGTNMPGVAHLGAGNNVVLGNIVR
jgi:hypothetical protein